MVESILKHLSNDQNVSPLFAASKREANLVWDGKFWTERGMMRMRMKMLVMMLMMMMKMMIVMMI